MLHRRRESSTTHKSDGYSSKKHLSIQSKKRDCKERESFNARNVKKEPVIPAYTQPPVVEGWAKVGSMPFHGGGYHLQTGSPNMHSRNRCPAPIAHSRPGNPIAQMETKQIRMHSGPPQGYVRPPAITVVDYNHMSSSKYSTMNIDKPVKQIINIPPPPPLENFDLNSPYPGQGIGNIQSLPYESSPAISHGNSSDDESDLTESCKTDLINAHPPLAHVADTSNVDVTETNKTGMCSTRPPVTNVTVTPDVDVTKICKASLSSAQPPETMKVDSPNVNTACATYTPSKIISKASQRELQLETVTEPKASKDKEEITEGVSKDHYQHLDKRQKMKLYEKRKKYYYESRKRYHAEKDEKKKIWYKEYLKRKKDYYHLKIYLYKEKKKEDVENKLRKSNTEDRTSEVLKGDSQLCDKKEASEPREASSNIARVAEEMPYSPSGSPVDYDNFYSHNVQASVLDVPRKQTVDKQDQEDSNILNCPTSTLKEMDKNDEDFFNIDVQASLLDDVPRRQTMDQKDQDGSNILNCPTSTLKEMIIQVMNTLHQQPADVKCNPQDQSADPEVKSKEEYESKVNADKSQPFNSTSSIPSQAKTSESLHNPSTSLTTSLQQTPKIVPSVTVSSTLGMTPLPTPLPSHTPFSQPSCGSSKGVLEDSSPQPVPSPTTVHSLTFSSTSVKHMSHDQSSSYMKTISTPKTVNSVDLPSSAPPLKYPTVGKSQPEVQNDHSVPSSTPESDTLLPPLPSLPALPHHGKQLGDDSTKSSPKDSGPLLRHGNVFPPLPPPPPPPITVEEINRKISGSIYENNDRLQEQNAFDDMTEVPMDIDSDNETTDYDDYDRDDNVMSDYHDNARDDHVLSDYHDNVRDGNVMSDYHDNVRDGNVESDCHDNDIHGNEVSYCHDSDKGDIEVASSCDSDKEFLSLFGIHENESPSLEEKSDDNLHMRKLLKKLMKVNNTNESVDTLQSECGPNTAMDQVTNDSTRERPSTSLNPATHNQQEMDCNPLRIQNVPSVSNLNLDQTVSPSQNKEIVEVGSQKRKVEVLSNSSCKPDGKMILPFDTTQSASPRTEIEIIEMKEPPKNLICVDELLMSVEAADQPPDLQIIYTDLRDYSGGKKNIRVSTFC